MLLINFIFSPTFFLIASYQILKNYAILINYKSLFQEKDSLQLKYFQFSKMNREFKEFGNLSVEKKMLSTALGYFNCIICDIRV